MLVLPLVLSPFSLAFSLLYFVLAFLLLVHMYLNPLYQRGQRAEYPLVPEQLLIAIGTKY